MTYVWRDDSPFCPLSAAPSRISSLLSAASCPPSGTGVHLLRHSCVELWLALTMQHSRRQAVSKQQFASFGISFLISSLRDRKSTRLNSSHTVISYAVFCLKKKKIATRTHSQSCESLTTSH